LDTSQEQSRLPLGTIRLYRLPNTSIGKLGRLAVDLSARGLGLGRKLVETMEEDAKQSGITFIDVHSQVDKRTFYEKLGYHVVDDEVFVEDGIDHIKMGKSLI
jgi:predicted GNAT family N-acyltransferase